MSIFPLKNPKTPPEEEKYVLVSQEQPQEPSIDLADLVVVAWKNRFLLVVSWFLLASASFALLQFTTKMSAKTVVRSGNMGLVVQTPEQIKNQITEIIFPTVVREIETNLKHNVSATIKVDIPKNSEIPTITIASSDLSESAMSELLQVVTQSWKNEQSSKIEEQRNLINQKIEMINSEIVTLNNYADELLKIPDLFQQGEAARVLVQIERQKQVIYEFKASLFKFQAPFVLEPFNMNKSGFGSVPQSIGISAMAGFVLACGVVLLVRIAQTARIRLADC
jgi:hypothetical protein